MDRHAPHLLTETVQRARSAGAGRSVVVIAEDDRNDAAIVTRVDRGGLGVDGVWADDFHHQLRRAFAGDSDGYYADYTGSTDDLVTTLRDGWFYQGQRSRRLGRSRGTPAVSIEPARFVHCIQNHDQIGNRATGDRLAASVDSAAYKAMSALLLLSPYTPLLFMGQEWNATTPFMYFTDHHSELGALVTAGRQREFAAFSAFTRLEIPDPQSAQTFERSRLDWNERTRPDCAAVLEWYRTLLALRAGHRCLQTRDRASFTVSAAGDHAIAIERRAGADRVLVIVNIRGALTYDAVDARTARVLANSSDPRFGGNGRDVAITDSGRIAMLGPGALAIEY